MVRPRWNLKAARISSPAGRERGQPGQRLSSRRRRYPAALPPPLIMPIQLSSASACDICCEPFSASSSARRAPHSIPCGHVFCKRYVSSTYLLSVPRSLPISCLCTMSQCPNCRRPFGEAQVRRLHVSGARTPQSDALVSRALRALDSTGKDMQSDILQAIEDAEHNGEASVL